MVLYEGCLTTEIRASLLELLYSLTDCSAGNQKEIRQHCGVALEMLDNAQRYGATGSIRFEWLNSSDGIEIKILNTAKEQDAFNMLDAIERVKSMNEIELKNALVKQMLEGDFGEKGGAGLGILQIVSRAGNHLNARIERTDDDTYLCESTFKTMRA